MAVTQLSDLKFYDENAAYVVEESTVRSAFWQSGIVGVDPRIQEMASASQGNIVLMPKWNDLTDTESNVSSDDPSDVAVPDKVGTGEERATILQRAHGFSSADLSAAFVSQDPLSFVLSRVAFYWNRQFQNFLVNTVKGIVADNKANDGGDMVTTVPNIDDAGAVDPTEQINAFNVIDAEQQMGDAAGSLSVIAMHSVQYARLRKNNLITFIQESAQSPGIPVYMGKIVIVDDGMPKVTGTNRVAYTVALFGAGAVAYAERAPKTPLEVAREAAQGNGEGIEQLWSRRHVLLHPRGFSFTSASVAKASPSNAELATTANWNRVYDRKNIPIAFLEVND